MNSEIMVLYDENFNIISDILNYMLNKVMNDSDFYCAKIISFYQRLIIR